MAKTKAPKAVSVSHDQQIAELAKRLDHRLNGQASWVEAVGAAVNEQRQHVDVQIRNFAASLDGLAGRVAELEAENKLNISALVDRHTRLDKLERLAKQEPAASEYVDGQIAELREQVKALETLAETCKAGINANAGISERNEARLADRFAAAVERGQVLYKRQDGLGARLDGLEKLEADLNVRLFKLEASLQGVLAQGAKADEALKAVKVLEASARAYRDLDRYQHDYVTRRIVGLEASLIPANSSLWVRLRWLVTGR
jgi:chromosome segregation ATPase